MASTKKKAVTLKHVFLVLMEDAGYIGHDLSVFDGSSHQNMLGVELTKQLHSKIRDAKAEKGYPKKYEERVKFITNYIKQKEPGLKSSMSQSFMTYMGKTRIRRSKLTKEGLKVAEAMSHASKLSKQVKAEEDVEMEELGKATKAKMEAGEKMVEKAVKLGKAADAAFEAEMFVKKQKATKRPHHEAAFQVKEEKTKKKSKPSIIPHIDVADLNAGTLEANRVPVKIEPQKGGQDANIGGTQLKPYHDDGLQNKLADQEKKQIEQPMSSWSDWKKLAGMAKSQKDAVKLKKEKEKFKAKMPPVPKGESAPLPVAIPVAEEENLPVALPVAEEEDVPVATEQQSTALTIHAGGPGPVKHKPMFNLAGLVAQSHDKAVATPGIGSMLFGQGSKGGMLVDAGFGLVASKEEEIKEEMLGPLASYTGVAKFLDAEHLVEKVASVAPSLEHVINHLGGGDSKIVKSLKEWGFLDRISGAIKSKAASKLQGKICDWTGLCPPKEEEGPPPLEAPPQYYIRQPDGSIVPYSNDVTMAHANQNQYALNPANDNENRDQTQMQVAAQNSIVGQIHQGAANLVGQAASNVVEYIGTQAVPILPAQLQESAVGKLQDISVKVGEGVKKLLGPKAEQDVVPMADLPEEGKMRPPTPPHLIGQSAWTSQPIQPSASSTFVTKTEEKTDPSFPQQPSSIPQIAFDSFNPFNQPTSTDLNIFSQPQPYTIPVSASQATSTPVAQPATSYIIPPSAQQNPAFALPTVSSSSSSSSSSSQQQPQQSQQPVSGYRGSGTSIAHPYPTGAPGEDAFSNFNYITNTSADELPARPEYRRVGLDSFPFPSGQDTKNKIRESTYYVNKHDYRGTARNNPLIRLSVLEDFIRYHNTNPLPSKQPEPPVPNTRDQKVASFLLNNTENDKELKLNTVTATPVTHQKEMKTVYHTPVAWSDTYVPAHVQCGSRSNRTKAGKFNSLQ
jgi:hypothetical protein